MTVVPRGVANHNPGNLVWVETIQWQGQTGHDGRFCTFDSAANGIRALCKQLLVYQDKYGLRTIRGIINRWAPPVENDTGAYVDAVAHFTGHAPDDMLELHNDIILSALATAIITHENGQQPYAEDLIRNAARRALGWAFVPDIEPVDLNFNDSHRANTQPSPITDTAAPIEERDLSGAPPRVEPKEPSFMDNVKSAFGSFAEAAGPMLSAAAPIATMLNPGVGLALGLAGKLIAEFEPLAREKVTKELSRHTDPAVAAKIADNLLEKAKELSGHDDPILAVADVAASPEKIAMVQADVLDDLERMEPMLKALHTREREVWTDEEESRDHAAARAKGDSWDMAKVLVGFTLLLTLMTFGFLFWVAGYQVVATEDHEASTASWAAIMGIVGFITGVLLTIVTYRFGASRQSSANAVQISELSRRMGARAL